MTTLVLGASGATGRKLVDQLLQKGQKVKVIIRSPAKLPETWLSSQNIFIIQASITELSVNDLAEHLLDCQAVASCLGHRPDLKGIYGKPRKLVTEAIKLVCQAIQKNAGPRSVKVVLMNTAGNRNKDLNEPFSIGEKLITALLRVLVPPHPDNEHAAEFLRKEVGQEDPTLEWVVIRPDSLIDEIEVTEYEIYPSPIRSALFNPGKTSRINVGNFMARLIIEPGLWDEWKGQMPVLYNKNP